MGRKVDALNAIVETLGGESDATSIAQAITALGPYIGSGGSGGGNVAIVNFTTSSYQGPYTADKTAAEIYDHLSAGEQVVGMINMSEQAGSGSLGPITMTMNAVLACTMTTQKAESGERTFEVTFSQAWLGTDGTAHLMLYKSSSNTGGNVSYGLTDKTIS